MAQEARNAKSASRTCSNEKSGKNKYSDGQKPSVGTRREKRENKKESLYNRCGQRRNCYTCGGFGHIARNCRNQNIVGQERKIKYGDNLNTMNNQKKKSLVVLDQALIIDSMYQLIK